MTALSGLADHLRTWGLDVTEVPGWQDRRRPGPFNPMGVLLHHTAAPKGKDAPSLRVCIDGRSDLPGPLCQLLIARSGRVHVISANRCNHAGKGGPLSPIGLGDGNIWFVGIEAENDGVGEPWPPAQWVALVQATAAVLDLLGQPRTHCWGHKEWAPRRKIDPSFNMAAFRSHVAATHPPHEGDPMATADVEAAQRALNSWLTPDRQLRTDGDWGPASTAALRDILDGASRRIKELEAALTNQPSTANNDATRKLAALRSALLEVVS